MNNEKEIEFLNDTQKPVKERKNIFLKILVTIGWLLYIIIYFICGFIEILAALFLTSSIIKTTHKRKHKKRWF